MELCEAQFLKKQKKQTNIKTRMYGTLSVLLINQECAHSVRLLSFCPFEYMERRPVQNVNFIKVKVIQTYQKIAIYLQIVSVFVGT